MLLYLIRHGESEANADGTHSGWSPVNLTEAGRTQAASARSLLNSVLFDRIYVSDVKRAQQTAQLALPGRAYCYCSLIRELNNTAMRGKTAQEMLALYPDLYPVCRRRFDYAPLGLDCESGLHLLYRAASFLSMLQDESDKKVAAICHAGFIRACAAWMLSTPTHIPPLDVDNASVSILEYRRARWHIRQWNMTGEE